MNEGSKPAEFTVEQAERSEWTRPEFTRLDAGKAELGLNPGGDGLSAVS